MKFGGTSVAGPEAIRRTIGIIRSKADRKPVVVVSAMSKVTDTLYRMADAAARKDASEALTLLETLRQRHIDTAEQLLEGHAGQLLPAVSQINELCDELEKTVEAVCALGELSDRSKAVIVSNGELLSSTIICQAMCASGLQTAWVDARRMIITSGDYLNGEPVMSAIQSLVPAAVEEAYKGSDAIITQGFISSTSEGIQAVLGRGGSDYSASLIGMAIDAEAIEIWTDVDGVLTADPRIVPGAKRLERLSFEEAAEMAHFGSKVLHPLTIEPAVRKNIPIYVLNSMNPSCEGTLILKGDKIEDGVKSVSYKKDILVINIYSTRMINASGFLSKVFDIFSRNGVSVDLISTTEANISVTCDYNTRGIDAVVKELSEFAEVVVDDDKSQVSVVGKNLVNIPGAVRKIFTPLQGTKMYMISQGASYINLTIVVDRAIVADTVNAIHDSLFA